MQRTRRSPSGGANSAQKEEKMIRKMTWVAVLAALTSCVASADPNFFGQTGLTLNPTAYIAQPQEIKARGSWANQDIGVQDGEMWAIAGNGIISEKLELSVGYVSISDVLTHDSGLTAGLKYALRQEDETSPAVGLGVIWVDPLKQKGAYLAFSKTLSGGEAKMGQQPRKVRGHVGVRWDKYSFGTDESDVTFFGGLDAQLGSNLSFEGEVGTKHDMHTETPWSALLKYQVTRKTTISAGVVQTGFSDDPEFIVSVGQVWPNLEMK